MNTIPNFPEPSFTNSSLKTARLCLRKYHLEKNLRLEHDKDEEEREVLQVGTTWHRAHDARTKGANPYDVIAKHAPGDGWVEKLSRLFAAYESYWQDDPIEIVESERIFEKRLHDEAVLAGQLDAITRSADGRMGLLERKTTSEDLAPTSAYWARLRLDTQLGVYALSLKALPSYIIYDVVRKPTIRPKALTKAELVRMRAEVATTGVAKYYGEEFGRDDAGALALALEAEHESWALYGARLTADIGDRYAYYFARREVARSTQDYQSLSSDVAKQIDMMRWANKNDAMLRNPDACNAWGTCEMFALCSNNIEPRVDGPVPDGYRIREHLHVELVR